MAWQGHDEGWGTNPCGYGGSGGGGSVGCFCCTPNYDDAGGGFSGDGCNPQDCGPVAGECSVPLDTSAIDCMLPDAPGAGVACLLCWGDSGQSMSGNSEGTPCAGQVDENGNPIDACGNPVDACGNPSPYVCENAGAGSGGTKGGSGGQSPSSGSAPGFASSSKGGGGSQAGKSQPSSGANSLAQLTNMFARMGANLANAVKGNQLQTANKALVGKPGIQAAGIAGSGDMLIVIVVVVLLGSMLFIENREG